VNRIDRVSAMLIQLQTKKFVTANEIATRFEISKRTVYRDMKALEEAGVPLGAEPGKGYFIVDGYHLPPVMFTAEEASAMLTAEKIVEKMSDRSVDQQYKSAMYKIKSVLPEREKLFLERLTSNIEIFHNQPALSSEIPNNCMLSIQRALADKKVLKVDYRAGYNNELITGRMVEPVGLCFYGLGWHLVGFCRFRNDYRDFRIDRIVSLNITSESFAPRKVTSVREFFKMNLANYELEPVTIRVPKAKASLIQSTRYYYGYIGEEENGDYLELNFLTNDLEYFCRWLLMYADIIDILSNDKLKALFENFIQTIKNRK
jgi:predicted DNA-binding transcriptional regulator YafY